MLDNVTTVLLMAPVSLAITKRLELNPIAFLVTEALASNIGGVATLVGDPPNIMIASKAELGYLDFLVVLGPIAALIMAVFVAVFDDDNPALATAEIAATAGRHRCEHHPPAAHPEP